MIFVYVDLLCQLFIPYVVKFYNSTKKRLVFASDGVGVGVGVGIVIRSFGLYDLVPALF